MASLFTCRCEQVSVKLGKSYTALEESAMRKERVE